MFQLLEGDQVAFVFPRTIADRGRVARLTHHDGAPYAVVACEDGTEAFLPVSMLVPLDVPDGLW